MFIPSIALLFACSQDFDDTDKPEITYTRDSRVEDSDTAPITEPDAPLDTGDPVDTDTNDTVDTGLVLSILGNPSTRTPTTQRILTLRKQIQRKPILKRRIPTLGIPIQAIHLRPLHHRLSGTTCAVSKNEFRMKPETAGRTQLNRLIYPWLMKTTRAYPLKTVSIITTVLLPPMKQETRLFTNSPQPTQELFVPNSAMVLVSISTFIYCKTHKSTMV